ncbi:MAG: MerR family transcriptional regulator [Pseudomonadota bacterium]
MSKSSQAFRTIREVSDWLDVKAHVLRFWESKFPQIKPVKRAGGRRYYRPGDMELVGGIKVLLHEQGMTIKGVQHLIRTEGTAHVTALSPPIDSFEFDDEDDGEFGAWDRELAAPEDAAQVTIDAPPAPLPESPEAATTPTDTPEFDFETPVDGGPADVAPDEPSIQAEIESAQTTTEATLADDPQTPPTMEADPDSQATASEEAEPDVSMGPTDPPAEEPEGAVTGEASPALMTLAGAILPEDDPDALAAMDADGNYAPAHDAADLSAPAEASMPTLMAEFARLTATLPARLPPGIQALDRAASLAQRMAS